MDSLPPNPSRRVGERASRCSDGFLFSRISELLYPSASDLWFVRTGGEFRSQQNQMKSQQNQMKSQRFQEKSQPSQGKSSTFSSRASQPFPYGQAIVKNQWLKGVNLIQEKTQKVHIFTFTFSLFIVIAIHKNRENRFIFIYIFINIYINIWFSVNIPPQNVKM